MLIYKQRYKPRTTREFTKSDLTVYDSAGNTTLNALTVYGKSEVVDGAIVSAGEGWSTVDLGTLDWTRSTSYTSAFYYTSITGIKGNGNGITARFAKITNKYAANFGREANDNEYCFNIDPASSQIFIRCDAYTDATAFKTAMSGVLLCYQLADPTQGNAIAVKTDDGTGVNGTMTTFTTGTPLRGIPDSNVRDVMTWDGSAGTLMKKCGVDDLGLRTWNTSGSADHAFYIGIERRDTLSNTVITNLADYTQVYSVDELAATDKSFLCRIGTTALIFRNTAYTEPTDFSASMSGKKLIYKLATPTTEQLTAAENNSIAGLRTFEPQTHAQNNALTEMTVDYTIRVPTI